jgi:hypothetical protein
MQNGIGFVVHHRPEVVPVLGHFLFGKVNSGRDFVSHMLLLKKNMTDFCPDVSLYRNDSMYRNIPAYSAFVKYNPKKIIPRRE